MSEKRMRIVLCGVQPHDPWHPFLSLANLKAYSETDVIIKTQCDITIREFCYRKRENLKDLVSVLASDSPDVVGFACYIWNIEGVKDVARELKRIAPSTKIVLGGPSAEYDLGGHSLAAEDWVDVVVRGEGEETFLELVKALLGGREWGAVAGLTYRGDKKIETTSDRLLMTDLSVIPSPYATGAIDVSKTSSVFSYLEFARGCPYSCKFCQRSVDRHKPRYFPMERVVEDMKRIISVRGKAVLVIINADPFMEQLLMDRCLRAFKAVAGGKNVILAFNGEVTHVDDDLRALLNSPQLYMAFGVQSINKDVLKTVSRGFDREKTDRNLSALEKQGSASAKVINLMLPLPKDTPESYLASLNWAVSFGETQVITYRTQIYPGTELWNEKEMLGLTYDPSLINQVLSTPTFNRDEVDSAQELAMYVNLLRTLPLVRSLVTEWGHSLSDRERNPHVRLYQDLLASLRGQDAHLKERLDRRYEMEWNRRGLYFYNEWTLSKEERVAVIRGGKTFFRGIEDRYDLKGRVREDWERRCDAEILRYEWLDALAGYMRSLETLAGPGIREALLIGADLVPSVESMNGDGWKLKAIDLTSRPYYSIRQLTLSRQWDAIRVRSYEELAQGLGSQQYPVLVMAGMAERLERDGALQETLASVRNALSCGGKLIFIGPDEPSPGNEQEGMLARLGFHREKCSVIGECAGRQVSADVWWQGKPA